VIGASATVEKSSGRIRRGLGGGLRAFEGERRTGSQTVFEYLQRRYAGQFEDGQLRTLQASDKDLAGDGGASQGSIFAQQHPPGRLGASDFTHMEELGVTLKGKLPHLIYHFVLTYSNWEAGTVCYSESFESLCEGLQNAVWKLGKVPQRIAPTALDGGQQRERSRRVYGALPGADAPLRLEGKRRKPGMGMRTATWSSGTIASNGRWRKNCCCAAVGTSPAWQPTSGFYKGCSSA